MSGDGNDAYQVSFAPCFNRARTADERLVWGGLMSDDKHDDWLGKFFES